MDYPVGNAPEMSLAKRVQRGFVRLASVAGALIAGLVLWFLLYIGEGAAKSIWLAGACGAAAFAIIWAAGWIVSGFFRD